jgi:hypothetical protein
MNEHDYWQLIHAERARLADLLATLGPDQWAHEPCAKSGLSNRSSPT